MKLFAPLLKNRFGGQALLFFAITALISPTVSADPERAEGEDHAAQMVADAPHPFNGSFAELSARTGPLISSIDDGSLGWTADLGFRNAFPLYLGANRLAYSYGRASIEDRVVQLHGLHAALGLHPFYLALLSEGWLSHLLASMHLELGIGPRFVHLAAAGDETEAMSRWGLAGSVGGGFDLPLSSPNQGKSFWINILYHRTWSTVNFDTIEAGERLHDHRFFLGLAWRSNGTIW